MTSRNNWYEMLFWGNLSSFSNSKKDMMHFLSSVLIFFIPLLMMFPKVFKNVSSLDGEIVDD